jgi:hypothetical protein
MEGCGRAPEAWGSSRSLACRSPRAEVPDGARVRSVTHPGFRIRLVLVCCAGPLLLGALIASGAGGWLATHGFVLGGGAALVIAALLAVRAWLRVRQN